MDAIDVDEQERKQSVKILRREAEHLLDEIERLEGQRELQIKRLRNVMDLVSRCPMRVSVGSDFS